MDEEFDKYPFTMTDQESKKDEVASKVKSEKKCSSKKVCCECKPRVIKKTIWPRNGWEFMSLALITSAVVVVTKVIVGDTKKRTSK